MKSPRSESIVFVTSDLYCVKGYLLKQIKEASKSFDVCLVVNADQSDVHQLLGHSIKVKNFNIQRKISIIKDLHSLLSLFVFLLVYRPSIVHSTTPKAGLLAMVASFVARIPFRLHTFTGQVWLTRHGFFRYFLKNLDKLTALTATHILCDSHSQRSFLLQENVIREKNSSVILNGSIRGVDPEKFMPREDYREEIRRDQNIKDNSVLILYMARFTVDKGALLMADAFKELALKYDGVFLLMVGPDEESLAAKICSTLTGVEDRFAILNYTDCPEKYFAACDIFCLPSFREGFPMVLLNAAASAVPVVASRIYGSSDVVMDRQTGLLFNSGDVTDLVNKLSFFLDDLDSMRSFGINARNFAIQNFSENEITMELMKVYRNRGFH